MKIIKIAHWRIYLAIAVFTVLAQISITASAAAEVKGPGWFLGSADLVSPSKSRSILQALSAKKNRMAGASTTVKTMNVVSFASSSAESPEIAELARALHYDPKLLYDFVYNNIEYVPYFGLLKGPTQTLLDRSGNDFDQAALLVALLRESGYTASFVHGTKYLSDIVLSGWLGVEDWISTNRTAVLDLAVKVWASGGIPGIKMYTSKVLVVEGVWVKANISGTDYIFDPSYKLYNTKSKIDIGSAIGYNRNEFLNAVKVGAAIGADSVQNLNQANLNNKLTGYAMNLINTLHSQYPNSDIGDIIGSRQIAETHMTQYNRFPPYTNTVLDEWPDIPKPYIATLRVQHEGIDYTFEVPKITGRRLTLTYAGSGFIPELRLDGTLVASGRSTSRDVGYDMILSVDHPYAAYDGTYFDQTSTYKCMSGSTYAIVSDFAGSTTDALLRKRQKELGKSLDNDLSDTSEQVLGETLNIMGLTWMKQTNLTDHLLDQIIDTIYVRHHSIGIMAQEKSYYIDLKMNGYSGSSKRTAGFYTGGIPFLVKLAISSAFEHAIIEQLMGSNRPGASTIKLMQIANSQGSKIFWANSSNFSSIQPQLRNYSAETSGSIQKAIGAGKIVILPENGGLTINQWRGAGYVTKYSGSDGSATLGMIINGDYFGGYGSVPGFIDPLPIYDDTRKTLPDISYDLGISTPTSSEPVDMATGAYLYDRADIALGGSAPIGLEFHRSYNSNRNREKRSMGNGWQHNYDIFLSKVSDGNPGLGLRTPIDAAAMITNLYISEDLMRNEDNLTGWVTMFLAHKWTVDQLIDNAISVNIGGQVTEYIKLPDGTYANPPGITTELVDNGNGTFSLKERFGTEMDFDTAGRIILLRDVDGNTLNFAYTGNKIIQVQDAAGRYLTFNYNRDNITSVMDSEGRSTAYNYDGNNNLISYADVEGKTWTYGYDTEHQMTTLGNPLGITTAANTYDTLGRVKTQIVPRDGAQATYNFYFSEFRNVEEDPFGRRTIYWLDEKGRTYAVEDGLSNKTTKTFDGQNHEISIKNARNYITKFTYDGNQNLTKITDALNKTTSNIYDAKFRLTDTADSLNHTTHFDYDSKHHLIQTSIKPTDTETISSSLTYYSNGKIETTIDGRGIVSSLIYDSNNNPYSTRTSSHPEIRYSYDKIGRMLSLTDQEGAATTFSYDNRGLLLRRTDPLDKRVFFVYDDAGRLISRTDRNNNTITYTYTPSDKLKTITYPDGSKVTFTYDLHDKLIKMQDTIGTTTYTYDAAYRLKSISNPYGKGISYDYDRVGNVTRITYPGNKAVYYTYDALNHLKIVKNWLSQTATYSYDDAGRLTSVTNFNGTVTDYIYDNANRLISLQNKTPGGMILSSYAYTLDGNGNQVKVLQQEPISPMISTENTSFVYNLYKNRLLSTGPANFTYSDEGELMAKGNLSYSFDYEHRLKGISGADSMQFLYDGSGNRLQATRSGVVTRYIYDVRGNLLAETDSSNTITKYYVYGRGLLAMITPSGQAYTYHYNGIGSTILMTDQNKNIINKYSYTPFGLITSQQENIAQPFKYAGGYGIMYEPNGLYYMRARYYDPEIGRFISEDPLGFKGGINLYVYVNDNPINFVDPKGEWALQATAAVLGASTSYFLEAINPESTPASQATAAIMGGIGGLVTTTYPHPLAIGGMAALRNIVTAAVRGDDPTISSVTGSVALGLTAGYVGKSIGWLSESDILGKLMGTNISLWVGAAFSSDYNYQTAQSQVQNK